MRHFHAAVILLCAVSASAQIATTTSLVGTITDSSGKSIANAKSPRSNRDARYLRRSTNDQGYFTIGFVRVGVYSVTAEQPAFRKSPKRGSWWTSSDRSRGHYSAHWRDLAIVTVEAIVGAIKTDDATISEIISARTIADAPFEWPRSDAACHDTPGVIFGPKSSATGTPPGEDFIGAGNARDPEQHDARRNQHYE